MARKVFEFRNYSSDQIKSLFKKDLPDKIRLKLSAIYMMSKGTSSRKLQEVFSTSFKQILNWAHQFDEMGLDGLHEKKRPGRTPRLNEEHKELIMNIVQQSTPRKEGIDADHWTGPLLADWIQQKYDISYKKAQIYNILKELGINTLKVKQKARKSAKKSTK